MADDPMLSLFDTDGGSFLDDLTGPGGGQSMDGNFMGQGMSGDQMIQQSQGFGVQISEMQGNQFNPYQQTSSAPEPFSSDSFNQYNAGQKLQQMNMNTPHSGITPNQPMMSPYRQQQQQQQFRPSQPNMAQPSPNMGGYGNYRAQQVGPRLPNPPQQHMQVQQSMPQWNPGQSSPSRPHYMTQSQNMIQSQIMPTSQAMQGKFLSHPDFPQMPSSNASDFFQSSPATSTSFQHFQGNPSSNPQSMYIQNRSQMPSVPISSPNTSMGHRQGSIQSMAPQQSQIPMQNRPTFQMQNTMGMPGFNSPSQQVPQQHALQYQGNFQQQQQPMNNVQSNNFQRFPFGQMPSNTPTKQGDASAQFNTSPNQNFHPSYPRMPSQRATTPSPMPPSTPEHASTPQVNPRAPASVPQMEQLVSPPGPHSNVSTPVSSPFHQPQVSSSGPNFQHSNAIQISTSLPNSNGIGPISPNVKNAGNVRVTMTNTEREIQYLQQQLNQLQAAGQTQQTQQKMLEVQEKIRSLRASQEIQRQKAQADQQGGYTGPTNGTMQTQQQQQPSQNQTNVAPVVKENPQVSAQKQQTMQQAQTSVQPQLLMPSQAVQQSQPIMQQQPAQVPQPSMQQPQPPVQQQQQQQTASQQPSSNPQQVFQIGQPMFVNQTRPPQNVLIVTSGTQRMIQPQIQQMPMHSPQKVQVILQVCINHV